MANSNLTSAKRAKNDEFYTRLEDIQNEVNAYLELNPEVFKGKVVYCNCDDPLESNFFAFFALKFNKLGLKRLITTSYKPSPIAGTLFDITPYAVSPKGRQKESANRFIIDDAGDINDDGEFNLTDIAEKLKLNKNNEWASLSGDDNYPPGDFRSKECVELLQQADIVVTNPPFSLFREFVAQLVEHKKQFLIIGSMNAITYKEIFPLIKDNKMWLGNGFQGGNAYFTTPNVREFANGVYDQKTGMVKFRNVNWFTNLDHGRRHRLLDVKPMSENLKFNPKVQNNHNSYKKYDNYDAIEVPYTEAIPSDYAGVMAVPISFLDKYNPDQFEILGVTQRNDDPYKIKQYSKKDYHNANDLNARGVIIIDRKPKAMYARILIRKRQ